MTTIFRPTLVAATTVLAALAVGTGAAAGDGRPLIDAVASPEGFIRVTDDTGTISVAVPESWDVRTGRFNVGHDGVGFPAIEASTAFDPPACDECSEAPHLPNFRVFASPYRPAETTSGCAGDGNALPFDNGAFVGHRMNGVGCDAAVDEVVASEIGGNLNISVAMVYSSVDMTPDLDAAESAPIFEVMLDSIAWTGSPYPAGPTEPVVFPYATFGDVPRLGNEPVRGTGCGADGSIGDVIPDGIWAGFVDVPAPGERLSVDLLCIFTPESAPGVLAGGTATILVPNGGTEPDVNYLVVNNNERERSVPASPAIEYRDAIFDGDQCVEGSLLSDIDHTGYQAWINIEGGAATWVIWGCDWFGSGDAPTAGDAPTPAPAPTPPPAPTAPPATAPPTTSANTEDALLQADCALLQSTIWEGDAFVGVEYPADGEPFTESLRQAIQYTRDMFSYEVSMVQSQLAQSAFAQYYAEWDSLLQAGIYTSTNIGAVTQAGQFALAPLQNACGWAG